MNLKVNKVIYEMYGLHERIIIRGLIENANKNGKTDLMITSDNRTSEQQIKLEITPKRIGKTLTYIVHNKSKGKYNLIFGLPNEV